MRELANLFSNPENGPLAWRDGELISFSEFRAAVAANASKLRKYHRVALNCRDSYNFTIGLFAALHAGAAVILPSNHQAKIDYEQLIDDSFVENNNGDEAELSSLDENRLALEFFTSGSSGEPKCIIKNLRMLQNEVVALEKLWGDKSGRGPVFATVPHQHFYSLIFKILWPLASGRPFAANMHGLWEELLPELTADAVIISSPAHLERLGGVITNVHPRRIFCAGAKLSPAAAKQVEKTFHCLPTEIFGSTETGAIATRQQITGDEEWRVLPGIEIRTDESGALQVKSPFIGEEFFATSDIIEKTATGFRHRGRADRIVKVAGKRVSLPEVEQGLAKLEMVKAAAVVYLKEKERLAAAIVLKNTDELAKLGNFRMGRKLREELAAGFEPAALPKLWRFVEELPINTLGKQREADIIALFDL